jgi:hypothetical protein
MLLEVEMDSGSALGGRKASDWDIANCVSSSIDDEEEIRDRGRDVLGDAEVAEGDAVEGNGMLESRLLAARWQPFMESVRLSPPDELRFVSFDIV